MKKSITIIFSFLFVSFINFGQTVGELTVSVSTSQAGGNYQPRNVLAIWVADESGNFVKTLMAYANRRKTHLNTWQATTSAAGSAYNTVDAITGATKLSHATRVCSWNGTDVNGDLVPDGVYKVWMELTDKNATGNFSSFPFSKGTAVDEQSPSNKPSFSSISINWTPVVTTSDVAQEAQLSIYPNPGQGKFSIQGEDIQEVVVRTITGKLIHSAKEDEIDLQGQVDGIYLAYIRTSKGTVIRKLIKY